MVMRETLHKGAGSVFSGRIARNKQLFHTAVPKQKESISLDAGLRLQGVPALKEWDTVTDVLEPPTGRKNHARQQTSEDELTHGGQEGNRQH